MDGLTTLAAAPVAPVREGSPSRTGVAVHMATAAGMLALMVPVLFAGHASLAGIGATFAYFAWAAVAAGWARRRGGDVVRGAVGDPFAMGLLMAVPYLALAFGGHAHGGGETAQSGPVSMVIIGVLIVGGWVALRAGGARADRGGRVGFWSCLVMLLGMLVAMGVSAA
ncbi:hypothetical protein [Microbacterium sp. W4I20]|uniref:hypothetical protein n=1 Tax=Microbacterium sp. W4I20 TaxID=3042262 RepID=UPI00277D5DA7|nr:hypothetical protein [Microbacterium sp. W4I20]MDQ0727841.1 hypothetical protein [Microbacterium sp. W4I20]